MDTKQLVEAAMVATGCESARAFGRHLHVSHVAVGFWLSGERTPTFEQAAELAELAGLPPIATAAEIRLSSPEGVKHRRLLRRLASAAAALTLCVVPMLGNVAAASVLVADSYQCILCN